MLSVSCGVTGTWHYLRNGLALLGMVLHSLAVSVCVEGSRGNCPGQLEVEVCAASDVLRAPLSEAPLWIIVALKV